MMFKLRNDGAQVSPASSALAHGHRSQHGRVQAWVDGHAPVIPAARTIHLGDPPSRLRQAHHVPPPPQTRPLPLHTSGPPRQHSSTQNRQKDPSPRRHNKEPAPRRHKDPSPRARTASSSSKAVISMGMNSLDRLKERHQKWPMGGLAELLHNSKEAHARVIEIESFLGLGVEDSNFALQITDNGHGMSHKEIEKMFVIGSDKKFAGNAGIGGYGMGFKSGVLANAHTAVVFTKSTHHKTYSVGIFSNEPVDHTLLDLVLRQYVLYGVKYIDLVSLRR